MQVTSQLDALSGGASGGAERLFVGGFSMGGGLALHLLRRSLPPNLCGVFTIGSFLTSNSSLLTGNDGALATIPVLMMHGAEDQLVPPAWGRATGSSLLLSGVDVQFREYSGLSHEIGEEQLADLLLWMDDVLHRLETRGQANRAVSLNEGKAEQGPESQFPFVLESLSDSLTKARFMVPEGA